MVLTRRLSKTILFLAALVPAALLVHGILASNLGVNPAETIQLSTGRWTLKFLIATLAITPLRRLFHWNVLIQYRRMLGLFAFFYACLHFAAYIVLDQYFSFDGMMADVVRRPFITMGFAAWLLLLPLALTSTKGWIRRLGKRWTKLHALVYVAIVCGVIHFAWKVKVFHGDAVIYAVIVTALLAIRVLIAIRHGRFRQLTPRRAEQTSS